MARMQVLLVEDDPMLAQALGDALVADGWIVDHAIDHATARIALTDHGYDVVLLDLGLPGGSGLSLLRSLRQRHDVTPVMILTARDRLSDRIAGLDAGADDYLGKPFDVAELLARLRAVLRRASGRVAPALTVGEVSLDPAQRRVTRGGKVVELSLQEYRTLLALMERADRLVTRDQLETVLYGQDHRVESNTVAVYIHQLRRKLGESLIVTVHGKGYQLAGGSVDRSTDRLAGLSADRSAPRSADRSAPGSADRSAPRSAPGS